MVEVKIEVSIDHTHIKALNQLDEDPSIAMQKLVEMFQEGVLRTDYPEDPREPVKQYLRNFEESQKSQKQAWTKDNFDLLILTMKQSMQDRTDIDELFSLLIAYGDSPTNKPTSNELKSKITLPNHNLDPEEWNQHLRKCKARLTISAKNLSLPSPFTSPYGKSPNRKHPIKDDFHKFLTSWIKGENESCLISIDGASHKESIDDLKIPPQFRVC